MEKTKFELNDIVYTGIDIEHTLCHGNPGHTPRCIEEIRMYASGEETTYLVGGVRFYESALWLQDDFWQEVIRRAKRAIKLAEEQQAANV